MKKKLLTVFILFSILLVFKGIHNAGLKSGYDSVGLAEIYFRVVDAESNEDLGAEFGFKFPSSKCNAVYRYGKEFCFAYWTSDTDETIEIEKKGYETQTITVSPKTDFRKAEIYPANIMTIKLKPIKM